MTTSIPHSPESKLTLALERRARQILTGSTASVDQITTTFAHLLDYVQAQLIGARELLRIVSGGYDGAARAETNLAQQRYHTVRSAAANVLKAETIATLPPSALRELCLDEYRKVCRAAAAFIVTMLSDHAVAGVCGRLERLGEGGIARSTFELPYRRSQLSSIPVGEIVSPDEEASPATLWLHCHEFHVESCQSVGHWPLAIRRRGAACEVVIALPSVLHTHVRLIQGKRFRYQELASEPGIKGGEADIRPVVIWVMECLNFVLLQWTPSDTDPRPEMTSWRRGLARLRSQISRRNLLLVICVAFAIGGAAMLRPTRGTNSSPKPVIAHPPKATVEAPDLDQERSQTLDSFLRRLRTAPQPP